VNSKRRRITKSYYNYYYVRFKGILKNNAIKYSVTRSDIDDNFVMACRELLYAMVHYNGSSSLITFLSIRVAGKLRHARDKNAKFPIILMESILLQDHSYEQDFETSLAIKEAMGSLTGLERNIVIASCMENIPLRQISVQHKISHCMIHNIKKQALKKLGRLLIGARSV